MTQYNIDFCLKLLEKTSPAGIATYLRYNQDFASWVEKQYNNPQTKTHGIYVIINGLPPKCRYGNDLKFKSFKEGYWKACIVKSCKCHYENRIENYKQTMVERYGITNGFCLESTKQKTKKTMLQKYGVEYGAQTQSARQAQRTYHENRTKQEKEAITEKTKQTMLDRYGIDHHMKLVEQKEKVKATNRNRYGVDLPLQNETIKNKLKNTVESRTDVEKTNIREKIRKTFQEKYNIDAPAQLKLSPETYAIIKDKNKFIDYISGKTRPQVMRELGICYRTLYLHTKDYDCNELYGVSNISEFEHSVFQFVKELVPDAEQGNRKILSNSRELDIFCPSNNLAIECSGLYWHSELSANRTKEYHYSKFEQCGKQNIKLLTIFDDQWRDNPLKIQNIIKHALKLNNYVVSARKCQVKEITHIIADRFIEEHHMQGNHSAKLNYGLFYNDQLLAVMTFSKPRYNKKHEWEILRYCSDGSIPGAAGKLLN